MPPSGALPGFIQDVAPLLDRWGYLAVAGIIGVESFGFPAPGQTIMIAAAVYASTGRLNIFGVAAVCLLAAVLGDSIGYWIGRKGGRRVVHRFGRYILLTPARLDKAEEFFTRRGGRIVVVARFIDGLRQFNGVIAGITGMRWRTFLACNALGAVLWVSMWTTIGHTAGSHIGLVFRTIHHYQWYATAVIVLVAAAWTTWHLRRRKRLRAADASDFPAAGQGP